MGTLQASQVALYVIGTQVCKRICLQRSLLYTYPAGSAGSWRGSFILFQQLIASQVQVNGAPCGYEAVHLHGHVNL